MIRKRGSAPIAEKRLANLFVLAVPDWRFIFLRSCLWVRLCAQTQTKDLGNGKCRYFGAQPPIPGCVSQPVRQRLKSSFRKQTLLCWWSVKSAQSSSICEGGRHHRPRWVVFPAAPHSAA